MRIVYVCAYAVSNDIFQFPSQTSFLFIYLKFLSNWNLQYTNYAKEQERWKIETGGLHTKLRNGNYDSFCFHENAAAGTQAWIGREWERIEKKRKK